MKSKRWDSINDKWILDNRGKKNPVDWHLPYAWNVEKERTLKGQIENTGTVFLTNKECPYRCLMCDLWKNTTDSVVPPGAIPGQIEWALQQMPGVKHLKLYNSGSFFDGGAIPRKDYTKIASLLHGFETVIVESHTSFINENVLRFRDLLKTNLQVAIGLETTHPEILPKLNKRMLAEDFKKAVAYLKTNQIQTRAFILHQLPFLSIEEGSIWTKRSIEFAFKCGIDYCIIIPLRAGNGAMNILEEQGDFIKPDIQSLEKVLEYGIGLNKGLVFADTWDLEYFSSCTKCFDQRKQRIEKMNLFQLPEAFIQCNCNKTRDVSN